MSLIGWWPLHENSGQAQDLSGNGNHGTVNGATQGVAGKMGQTSYSFDGSDDYVDCGDILELKTFTVSIWVRRDGHSDYGKIVANHDANDDTGWVLSEDDDLNDIQFNVANGSSVDYHVVSNAISNGNWRHIVATFEDGSAVKVYSDSELIYSATPSLNLSYGAENLVFGYQEANSRQYFNGSIADARIYNRVLTPQEIQRLYQWGSRDYTKPRYHNGNDTGAVSRFKFNGDVKDSWGTVSDSNITDSTSAGYGNGISGKAKKFAGSGDYIETKDLSQIDNASTLTYSAWIYLNSAPSSAGEIVGKGNSTNNTETMKMRIDSSPNLNIYVRDSGGNTAGGIGGPITTNEWYHVACVFNNGEVKAFLNTETVDTGSVPNSPLQASSNPLKIGGNDIDNHWFDGRIDDVRVYNRALKPYEVQQLYQWGTRGRDMRKLTVNRRG